MHVHKVHVVGHSSSTRPAVYLALKHPDVVKSVVLVSVGGDQHFSAGRPNRLSVVVAKCPRDTQTDEYGRCFRTAVRPPQADLIQFIEFWKNSPNPR
jgi:pimeloyl-ACP methyl ester carboxylesterase